MNGGQGDFEELSVANQKARNPFQSVGQRRPAPAADRGTALQLGEGSTRRPQGLKSVVIDHLAPA